MGLDMYLNRRSFVGNQYRDDPKKRVKVIVPEDQGGVTFKTPKIKDERVTEVTERFGYWRKANQIHKWFVANVQDGVDDCRAYDVSVEQLQELKETCEKVLKSLENSPTKKVSIKTGWDKDGDTFEEIDVFTDTSVAEELLPTESGFFFGSTNYDKWYVEDLKHTVKICEECIKEGGWFEYDSSW